MIKDIPIEKVADIAIGIMPKETAETDELMLWDVYLFNLKKDKIRFILVNAKSYGVINGEEFKTTTQRYYIDKVEGESAVKIEAIQAKLFEGTTEYWLSFIHNDYMYDKKYIFVKGSIQAMNFTTLPFLNKKGVMIK